MKIFLMQLHENINYNCKNVKFAYKNAVRILCEILLSIVYIYVCTYWRNASTTEESPGVVHA